MRMSTLEDWAADAATALGLPPDSMTTELRDQLLDVTRDVAHGVARVAGPLTTYLIGLAVGAGTSRDEAIRIVGDLAATRVPSDEPDTAA
jgi:hypothetical protein